MNANGGGLDRISETLCSFFCFLFCEIFCLQSGGDNTNSGGSISETFGELILYSVILHSVVLVFSGTFSEDHWMLHDSKDLS